MPGTAASYADFTDAITATIASSGTISDEIDLGNHTLLAIHMPAAWDAANLTFLASPTTGGTFQSVYDGAGTEVSITAAASRAIGVDTVAKFQTLASLRFIKIRSGTVATPVTQTAARSIVISIKR